MRYLTLVIITFLFTQFGYSQIHELGVFVGGSNFIGDVGATNYISPKKLTFGGIYKWNRSPRHSFRATLLFTELEGIDTDSNDPGRIERGYEFKNQIIELSAGMEFTFFDFDLHNGGRQATPYLYTGVSIAKHDNFFFNNDRLQSENTTSLAYGIPMVLGYKTTISNQLILALETGARFTLTDEIDGSVPDTKELIESKSFGNVNNNDWYTFTGITLTYTFGRNPCYCN